ncbi:chemotaxis protein CheB [Rhizocola hellebori]|uniref:protein-glutamate methylesterase n=1 Tax=Rhizocola hellebori TaxID=1392758 RepID=A0A8J3VER7_9ACTN|nr:chemotaxis protein CheB [Rhizocola hellebori]GIH03551.1 chemotaxis protein CheB [Rhizocola hellebori]
MYRDVVVVGASAGGVEALRSFVAALAPDLPASVFVVLHIPPSAPSALPAILSRVSQLPVQAAIDGEEMRQGRVYVAPPNHHLLLRHDRIRLSHGPSENGHRPAIDPLFRSAAKSFGSRTVGVVLSGSRDDGAAGLAAIAARGGLALIQDPAEALYASMPLAAQRATKADYVLPASQLGTIIAELATSPLTADSRRDNDLEIAAEVDVADEFDGLADPAGYGCPACGGALFELNSGPAPRYGCRVGHAWSPQALLDEQSAGMESALWTALRALEEKAALSAQLASTSAGRGHGLVQERHNRAAQEAIGAADIIRHLIDRLGAPETRERA